MIRFKLAVALLLGSTVACAQNERNCKPFPETHARIPDERQPTRMPRDEEQDSMIQ
ncbi:MAG: hypothetical protein ACLUEV_05760 [Alistipes sp.]